MLVVGHDHGNMAVGSIVLSVVPIGKLIGTRKSEFAGSPPLRSPALFRALPCFVPLNLPYKRMVRWVLEYWQSGGSQDLNQLKFIVPEGVY